MQRFFLVQAVLKTAYGESKARPRIVDSVDPSKNWMERLERAVIPVDSISFIVETL